ncbi:MULTISPECIES: hypothetical protein [unclassified Ruegeria]|uniref:hypothetical protein n=1 Tax=unclassified Ruegeria TaxID=2625375 RepID=UPI001490F9F8|nr:MULTISPECIES: hypothetical protein [unclassified Ruegeria]NOD88202.1 hypothetical protein [Ruegeria sp. HKCCD4318]NOE13111.1 hypothetical protein [Ruegeria sp. HKCCD4318-2]NOG11347.1 hypothetical protein [Ruegeria sp. HKCCD4315]
MTAFDALRPPALSDPTAAAYKDWFHLNVFLPNTGRVVLINLSLHGPPWDARGRAVGTALASGTDGDWIGGIEIASFAESAVDTQAVFLSTISMAVTRDGKTLHAKVARPEDGFEADLIARPVLPAGALDLTAQFGSGWIGWSAVPVLSISGTLILDGKAVSLENARGYHDHNWGRWFWGEDVAWEWGAWVLSDDITVVAARGTDKAHFNHQPPHVFLVHGRKVHAFLPSQINLSYETVPTRATRRLPGALAAIHPDRRAPDLPRRVTLQAESRTARFELHFEAETVAQLLLADPMRPGSGYINELAGRCHLVASLDRALLRAEGCGVFEYVE